MKRIFYILVVAVVVVACDTFAPVKKADAPKRLNFTEGLSLYGDVEALHITTYINDVNSENNGDVCGKEIYRFDERGSVEEHSSFSDKGALKKRTSYVYDANGNVVEYIVFLPQDQYRDKVTYVYSPDNKLLKEASYHNGNLAQERNYKYDANGNLIKNTWYDYYLMAGEVTIYKYNAKGQLIEDIFEYDNYEGRDCYADGTFPILYTVYKYDSAGRLIEKAGYDSEMCANLGYLHQYRYDSMDNLIESDEVFYCYGGEVYQRFVVTYSYSSDINNNLLEKRWSDGSTTYIYDSVNNLIEEVNYDNSGDVSSRVAYTYDDSGNNIEIARYLDDNSLISKTLYSYDECGNVIERSDDNRRVVYEITYRTQLSHAE